MNRVFPVLILFSNLLYVVTAQTNFQTSQSDLHFKFTYSLQRSVVPRHYDIDLTFTMNAFTDSLLVTGESMITLVVSSETRLIELHYVGRVKQFMLFSENDTLLYESCIPYNSNDEREVLPISFPDKLSRGHYTLYIKYENYSPESVLTAPYLYTGTAKSWFIYTNFKPYGARYLFPCWDEIRKKTTFSLTVRHDKSYKALSNTQWKRIAPRDEITKTQFRRTTKIYTSDVAIIIYPLDVLNMTYVPQLDGIAYHRSDRIPQLTFAFGKLISTKSYLSAYVHYDICFDMQYVIIPDIRTESIPSSELIIFKENVILYNKTVDSVAQKLEIMRLVTRTYLNLWFHHVVSLSSRTQMWLNEALAAFFQIQINVEQDLPSLFQVRANHESFHVDRNNFLMPVEANTYDSFQNIFLSSIKAPIIISMLEHVLTPPVFRDGMMKYLQSHKSKHASSDLLWNAMTTALDNSSIIHTDYDLQAMIYSWIRQPNYPIIEVRRNSMYEIVISRRVTEEKHTTNQTWWIPITYTLRTKFNFSNTVPRAWLTPERSGIILDRIRKTDWIIVNIQQSGYYRVNYEPWNWILLANELNSPQYTNIHVLNRAKLIDDAYYFMVTGYLNYNIFLNLTSYLSRETDYIAWYPMFKILEYLSIYFPFPESNFLKLTSYLSRERDYIACYPMFKILEYLSIYFPFPKSNFFKVHMKTILDPVLLKIGFRDRDGEDISSKLLRQEILKWACLLGNTQCKDIAHNNLKQHLRNPENHIVSSSRKDWIYCNGLLSNDLQTQQDMFLYLKRTKNYKQISEYLSCMKNPNEIYMFFLFVLANDNQKMTDTERLLLLYSVIEKCTHMKTILKYYDEHEFHDDQPKTLSILMNHVYSLDDINELRKYVHAYVYERIRNNTIQEYYTLRKNLLSILNARQKRITELRKQFSILFDYKQDTSKVSSVVPIVYDVTPLHYNIELKILNYTDVHHLFIECKYEVTIMIHHATREIRMDYFKHEFKFSLPIMLFYSNETHMVTPSFTKIENHIISMQFENTLSTGKYILKLLFQNILDEREGNYFMKLNQNYHESKDWFDVIYFNPNEAAHIFPCWIDPAIKSTFNISLHHRHWYTALSNMQIKKVEDVDAETKVSHFYTTPPLSVNSLVMIMLNSYTHKISTFYNINHQIWCRPHFMTYVKYMSDVAHIVTIYFHYVAVLRDISKIDHIIIHDLQDDGSGTYGCILYDEAAVAYDKEIYPIGRKLQVTALIARAVANQLFGDIVDASEVHGSWLNDGLLAYFAYRAIIQVAPEGRLNKFFAMLVQHESLHLDANGLMNHIYTVNHASGSKSHKSFARYFKAPAIARMLQYVICKDAYEFIKILRQYFQARRFQTNRSFYEFIQKHNSSVLHAHTMKYGIPKLQVLMDTWIAARDYPVVNIIREYSTNKTFLSQETFNEMDRREWWIPITYTTQTNINFSDTSPKAWLKPNEDSFILSETVQSDEWIIFNLQQTGYYRVNYDHTNWNLIAKYLNSHYWKIHVLNRAQIIDDAYHLMMMHKLDYDIFINLTSYLSRETDYVAWYPMFKILEYLSPFFPFEESTHFKDHMRTLLANLNKFIDGTIYEVPGENGFPSICLKQEAARWACILNEANCTLTANSKLIKHLEDPIGNQLLPGWKEWTICNGLSVASNVTWHTFWDRYEKTFVNRTLDIISCSGGFENPNFLLNFKRSENTTVPDVACNLLYFVVMMNGTNRIDITLINLIQNIYFCKPTSKDITKVLTVIINRLYFEHHFTVIEKFVEENVQREDIIPLREALISRHYFIKNQKQAFSMLIKQTRSFSIN